MFRRLFRLLLTLVVVGSLVWFFTPRIIDNAANSLISSADSSVANAQGLAQFVPAGVNSASDTKGDLQINLTGLAPNTTYDLTLDQDECGGPANSLGSVTSDANGSFYIEIPLTSLNITQTWFVDVQQQGNRVACGQLQTNQDVSTQVIDAAQSGPNVFGPQATPSAQPTQDAQSQSSSATTSSTTQNSDATNKPPHLPNTGVNSGNGQQYDNNQYPRKY